MSFTFADQHKAMIGVADQILAAARKGGQALSELPRLRLTLSKEVSQHVSEETAIIRTKRRTGVGVGSREDALISRYHDELLVWRQQLIICNTEWTPARIASDSQGFAAAFQPLRDALEARVRWEEDIFYPGVLAKSDLRRAVR